jgi:excisionase family DNA binding protein
LCTVLDLDLDLDLDLVGVGARQALRLDPGASNNYCDNAMVDDAALVLEGRLTVAQAARRLGVTQARVRHLIATGELPAERMGDRTWMLARDAVERRADQEPQGGRRFSPANAWAILYMLAGVAQSMPQLVPQGPQQPNGRTWEANPIGLSVPTQSGRWCPRRCSHSCSASSRRKSSGEYFNTGI